MDVMARQSHIIVNYLRNTPKEDLDSTYLTRDPCSYAMAFDGNVVPVLYRKSKTSTIINNLKYYLTTKGLHRLIYPDWNEDTFTLGKQLSNIFNVRDRWWFNEHQNKDQTMFIGAIQSYYKKFTRWGFDFFKQSHLNHDFRNINIDQCFSKKYYLEI
jgi:hypothetical protein